MAYLVPPAPEHEEEYLNFVQEWSDHKEEIVPFFVRYYQESYQDFLDYCSKLTSWETCKPGFVPSSNFFFMEGDHLVGALNLRHALNDTLLFRGGHIGYGVRPTERGKGHATTMLALGLEKPRALGLEKILITCNKTNLASAGVIVKNGGILENEVDDDGDLTQRFWVTL